MAEKREDKQSCTNKNDHHRFGDGNKSSKNKVIEHVITKGEGSRPGECKCVK